ncbi:MAG: hypothetical protein ACODAJ_08720 [Planctomycetota bacterium]
MRRFILAASLAVTVGLAACGGALAAEPETAAAPETAQAPGDEEGEAEGRLIDWPIVGFQILNFLVLVALLKHFLYGRVIKAMDKREERIASRLREAKQKREVAEAEAEKYRQKMAEVDAQREQMMAEAREEAKARRAELIDQARSEVDALESRWRESVERQRASFLQDLRQRATRQTFAIARKVLADLSDAALEARIVEVFLGRLDALPDEEWQALAAAAYESDDEERELVARSVFDLSDDQQGRIAEQVRGHCGDNVVVRFERAFDPLCGVELRGEGRKIAWSIENYLASLEESFAEAFAQLPVQGRLRGGRQREGEREEEEEEEKKAPGEDEEEERIEHEKENEKREKKDGREEIEDEDDDEKKKEEKNG